VFLLVLVVSSLSTLSGCGWVGVHNRVSKPNGFLLHGYVSVAGAASGTPGTPCASRAADIASGGPVKVVDADGAPLASGSLGTGVLAGSGSAFQCNFPFDISNVPGGPDTMVVLIGQQPAARFATSELREGRAAVISVPNAATPPSPS
jgi:hypothetical protein